MFLILTSANLIAEICERPCFVRRQDNGVVILSDKENADAIYSNDSNRFYQLKSVNYLNDTHTLVEVESVPESVVAGYYFYDAGEFYTTEKNLAELAKAKAPEVASLAFVMLAESEAFDDTTLTEHAEQFSEWASAASYKEKSICKYDGALYRCLQMHTSQEDWTPDKAASLWKKVGDPSEEWPAWSQPLGATDAYQTGDKVSHNGKRWTSTAQNNVWEPGVYGWEEAARGGE